MTAPTDLESWRNRIAVPLANGVLRVLATRSYRERLNLYVRVGMARIAQNTSPEEDEALMDQFRKLSKRLGWTSPAP